MSESAATSQLPVARVVLQERSAAVTLLGETRECSAVSQDALDTVVMNLLMMGAQAAGGEVHVIIEGTDNSEFILATTGEIRPAQPAAGGLQQPSFGSHATNPYTREPAPAQAPDGQRSPAPVFPPHPFDAAPPGAPVGDPADTHGHPSRAAVDPLEVDPATWGFRGWLNRAFKTHLAPTAEELDHRHRQADLEYQDGLSRQRLLRETTRTLGYCGYLTVMSEKGGIGKTTISCLLAWFIAEVRQQSVVVADLNPDKGSLAPRIGVRPERSIRDLVRAADEIIAFDKHVNQFLAKVPGANVSVLGGDTDPKRRETTSADDVETVARVFRPFFQVGILDNGTGITHSAFQGSLNVSHGAVIVVDNTEGIDDFVNSTLEHLEANEYGDLRQRVVLVVIESSLAPPVPNVDRRDRAAWERAMQQHAQVMATHVTGEQIAAKFRHKVRDVVIFPYDPALAGGGTSTIRFENLADDTRRAARQLAGSLIDDLVS